MGVYLYEYMDSMERFNETCLPPQDKFYSTLKGEDISDEDYKHAKTVWDSIPAIKMLEDY